MQLQAATVAFVGTAVATSDGGRQARVRVESVWKGPPLPAYLDISGSPAGGGNVATSIDRTYQVGQRYLFVPVNDERPFQDNSCTATQPYSTAVAANAPPDARPADPAVKSDPELGEQNWPVAGAMAAAAVAAAVAAAGLGIGAVLLLRRRPTVR